MKNSYITTFYLCICCILCIFVSTNQINTMSTTVVTIKVSDLKSGYSIFGNKGNVWGNTCHIAKGSKPRTMCDVPMLSSNWARIEGVEEIGCTECIALYNQEA